jgi:tRNA(Ile)-lysidine synthase
MPVARDLNLVFEQITGFFLPAPPKVLGVAVSGGSDSLGLLVTLARWADRGGPALRAVTVNHGLRPEAAHEACEVGRICSQLGVSHHVLTWDGWDGAGNLQDMARRARYDLIAAWAVGQGIEQVALAHTADDQAETFLMRLARESGLDGLSAMTARKRHGGAIFCRPTLRLRREALRDILREHGMGWIEDPSNENRDFDRIKARDALAALEPLGISAGGLGRIAEHLAEARNTLNWYAFVAARGIARAEAGDLVIDLRGFRILPDEMQRRILLRALKWVSGSDYGPRGKAMELLMESLRGGNGMTLHGCLVTIGVDEIRIAREYKAVAGMRGDVAHPWDGRWQMEGPWPDGVHIAALGGDGLAHCPAWRETGLPRSSLAASPAVWRGQDLIAAPVAGMSNGWRATNVRGEDDFFAAFLSH